VRVLVVNAGSSSLKLTLLAPAREPGGEDQVLAARELDAPRAQVDGAELRAALAGELGQADAVGHRIVHGGQRHVHAAVLDERVVGELHELVELAPLHQPKSLSALAAVSEALPALPAVACFDTAFHATLTPGARTYALPAAWRERWGLVRYGFHGLSHGWVARHVPQLVPGRPGPLRIVSCHLGAGASLCAIRDGRSLDTTMGFTPLEGLVMATRSGSVDPGLLLWLLTRSRTPQGAQAGEREQLSPAELADALEHRSGLLGLAGSADMRAVLERAAGGHADAQLALETYLHRLRAGIAAMSAALEGLDVLVFTGGVGERSAEIRARAAAGLEFLGVALDPDRNRAAHAGEHDGARGESADAAIGAEHARSLAFVIAAREDLEIALQVRDALSRR